MKLTIFKHLKIIVMKNNEKLALIFQKKEKKKKKKDSPSLKIFFLVSANGNFETY